MADVHGILDDVTSHVPEVPPVRLPGQHELPYEDAEPMESERHLVQCAHLIGSLAGATRDRPDLYVNGNMFVYFSPRQLKNEFFRGPDVFVVVGTEKKERLSWVLWEEMRLPDVVIELTSPSTRAEDYGPKKDVYERVWKTALYAIYDPATHALDAWELDGGRYVPATRTPEGDVMVHVIGMRLGVRPLGLSSTVGAPSLRWIDADGVPLPTYDGLTDQVKAARDEAAAARDEAAAARDEAAAARDEAAAARARADALEGELARLRRG